MVALAWTGFAAVFFGFAVAIPSLRARDHLERGRTALTRARSEMSSGSFTRATGSFDLAQSEFFQARDAVGNPFVSLLSAIPFAGRTPDAIRSAADVGMRVADAGHGLAFAVHRLRGGVDNLSLSGRRIPVALLTHLEPTVGRALVEIEDATRSADGIATTFVPRSIAAAGDELRNALAQASSALRSTDAFLKALPALVGMNGPQRYFLVPENPAELRGTGGSFSFWSMLSMDRGRLSLGPFRHIEDLPNVANPSWPSPDVASAYGAVNAAGDWRYVNTPADAPTSAGLITQLWKHARQTPIDGVIMVDVQALRTMLEAIGSVRVPGIPFPLTRDNVVSFVTNGAYFLPGNLDTRSDFVGIAAIRVFKEFLSRARGYPALRAVVSAAASGHIVLNATDNALQTQLTDAGVTGALAPGPGEGLFAVTMNNLAGNKADFYLQRTIDYQVTLLPDGRARTVARVTFRNNSPPNPPPKALAPLLVAGAGPADLVSGEIYDRATFTCGSYCTLGSSTVDGKPLAATAHVVDGMSTFTSSVRLPPQSSTTLTFTFDLTHAWTGDGAQGAYSLSMPTQPMIQDTSTTLTIRPPGGMPIAATSTGLVLREGAATWSGPLSAIPTLQVRFQRNAFGRIWWDLTHGL